MGVGSRTQGERVPTPGFLVANPAAPDDSRVQSTPETTRLDALATAAQGGDRDAVSEILRIVHPLMLQYCAARLRRRDDLHVTADDVAQEICLATVTALPRYVDQGKSFLSFVYGIAANKVADARRRGRIHPVYTVEEMPERACAEAGPEEQLLRAERSSVTGELMRVLAPHHREILVMRIVMGWSAAQTAQAIGTSAGVVRVMQHRALNKLRAQLDRDAEVRELVCA